MLIGMLVLLLHFFPTLSNARDIVFPSASGYTTDQAILGGYSDIDITQAKFAGLTTYANLPYVHCLAPDGKEVEKFDIAILGAPFDTVSGWFDGRQNVLLRLLNG
jgi:agmatinase